MESKRKIMNITQQQLEAAERGKAVEIEQDNKHFVLISREVFDHLAGLQHGDLDPEAAYPTILEAWDSVGSPDDATDYL
jgi:hypothetical protein